MQPSRINFESRIKSLSQSVEAHLRRALALEEEAAHLGKDRRNLDAMARHLVISDMIDEARQKLVECKVTSLSSENDLASAHLAIYERRVTSAAYLLGQVRLILDFRHDIFGKPLPTGGLWDK